MEVKKESIKNAISKLPDKELIEIVNKKQNEYTPLAIEVANEIIKERGGINKIESEIIKNEHEATVSNEKVKLLNEGGLKLIGRVLILVSGICIIGDPSGISLFTLISVIVIIGAFSPQVKYIGFSSIAVNFMKYFSNFQSTTLEQDILKTAALIGIITGILGVVLIYVDENSNEKNSQEREVRK